MHNERASRPEAPTYELKDLEHQRSLLIAENIPQLEVIGFLYRKPDQSAYWRIRNVSRKPAGLTVELAPLYWENYP